MKGQLLEHCVTFFFRGSIDESTDPEIRLVLPLLLWSFSVL